MRFINYTDFVKKYKYTETIEHNGNCSLYKSNNGKYAIKVDQFERLIADIDWLSQLSHPNILECLDISMKADNIYIAMEWCNSIKDLEAESYIYTLLYSFASLNELGILHGDIKPENIVYSLDSQGDAVVKIIDFGLTKQCIDGLYKGKAHTNTYCEFEYNDSDDQYCYNSILGDGYCIAKTIEELVYKIPDNMKPHIESLKKQRYERPSISDICKSLNIPIVPTKRNIPIVHTKKDNKLRSKYNEIVKNSIKIAYSNNISVRSLILVLHNVHRTINMLEEMSENEIVIFTSTHLALASAMIDFNKILSVSWFPEDYKGKIEDIKRMTIRIMNHMDCIISTPTLLETNSLEYALYNVMEYDYPNITYDNNLGTTSRTTYLSDFLGENYTSKLLDKDITNRVLVPTSIIPIILPDIKNRKPESLIDIYNSIYVSKHLLSIYSSYTNRLLYLITIADYETKVKYYDIFGNKVYYSTNKYYLVNMKGNSYLMDYNHLLELMIKK